MRNIYLLLHLFAAVVTALGQSQKQGSSTESFLNNLLENANSVSKTDSILYKKTIKNYLKMQKKHNT